MKEKQKAEAMNGKWRRAIGEISLFSKEKDKSDTRNYTK